MYLFIFESIGTSELILVGIVALIFLGPRKMPEIARKIGRVMADFRGTANEFKTTWEREVNFEEEARLLNVSEIESETVARSNEQASQDAPSLPETPEVKEVDPAAVEALKQRAATSDAPTGQATDPNNKTNWL